MILDFKPATYGTRAKERAIMPQKSFRYVFLRITWRVFKKVKEWLYLLQRSIQVLKCTSCVKFTEIRRVLEDGWRKYVELVQSIRRGMLPPPGSIPPPPSKFSNPPNYHKMVRCILSKEFTLRKAKHKGIPLGDFIQVIIHVEFFQGIF